MIELQQQFSYQPARFVIQVPGRLVRQQHARFQQNGPSDGRTLPLAPGQGGHPVPASVRQTDPLKRGPCKFQGLAPPHAADHGLHGNIFFSREFRQQMMKLKNKPQLPVAQAGLSPGRQAPQVLPFKTDNPARRHVKRAQNVQQRRLTGSGSADNGKRFPLCDARAHSPKNAHIFRGSGICFLDIV